MQSPLRSRLRQTTAMPTLGGTAVPSKFVKLVAPPLVSVR
jgi:hypothetical protein